MKYRIVRAVSENVGGHVLVGEKGSQHGMTREEKAHAERGITLDRVMPVVGKFDVRGERTAFRQGVGIVLPVGFLHYRGRRNERELGVITCWNQILLVGNQREDARITWGNLNRTPKVLRNGPLQIRFYQNYEQRSKSEEPKRIPFGIKSSIGTRKILRALFGMTSHGGLALDVGRYRLGSNT